MADDRTDPRPPRVVPVAAAAGLAPGVMVDRFAIVGLLGQGSMGAVYRARDTKLGRDVAIKVVHPDTTDPSARDRLAREARAAARLAHPNVVTLYEVGALGDELYLAMELIDGPTLRAWQTAPDRSWRDIVTTYAGAGRGLAAAHRAGVVHRDFKPDNVMVGRDGRARITDFGVAGAAEPVATGMPSRLATQIAAPMTTPNALIGSPAYMAPEQLDRAPATAASDQFAFAVALYEALYGARPFAGDDVATLRRAIADAAIRPVPAGTPVPAPIHAVLVRGLAADPSARFPTMSALVAALDRAPARTRGTGVMRHWRGLVIAAGVAAVAAVAVVAIAIGGSRGGPSRGSGSSAAPDGCRDGVDRRAATVWNDAVRDEIHAELVASGVSYAETAFSHLVGDVGSWVSSWRASSREVCEAAHRGGPAASIQARTACLDRVFDEITAVIAIYRDHPDAAAIERAPIVSTDLMSVRSCEDERALARMTVPVDSALYARIADVDRRLARAAALAATARWEAAAPLARTVTEEAAAIPWPRAEARALRILAATDAALGRSEDAEAAGRGAVDAAVRANDHDAAVEAWLGLVSSIGEANHRPDAALALRPALDSAVKDAGSQLVHRMRAGRVIAACLAATGHPEQAAAVLEPLIEEHVATGALADRWYAEALDVLVTALAADNRPGDARTRAQQDLDVHQQLFGADHPRTMAAAARAKDLLGSPHP